LVLWHIAPLSNNLVMGFKVDLQVQHFASLLLISKAGIPCRYKKLDSGEKVADGAVCLICARAFNATGLALEHKSIKQYLSYVDGDTLRHQKFMKAEQKLIDSLNASPDSLRLSKTSLHSPMLNTLMPAALQLSSLWNILNACCALFCH